MIRKKLKRIIKQEAVYKGDVNLKHAGPSKIYFDVKKTFGNPEALKLMARTVHDMFKDPTCITSAGIGGIPIATAISVYFNLPLTIVREKKPYGMKKDMDGYIPKNSDRVAIVDDVFTTGKSLERIIEIIEKTGAGVEGCYVVIKRRDLEPKFPLEYLFCEKEIINKLFWNFFVFLALIVIGLLM